MLWLFQRTRSAKLKIAIFISLVFVIFCFIHLQTKDTNLQLSFFKENFRYLDGINATECKLPKYDLYDPEIRIFIEKPATAIFCGYLQPYLTYLDWDGSLYINQTELEIHKYKNLKCMYQSVMANQQDDYKVLYGMETRISSFPIIIGEPVFRVKCYDSGKALYQMVHSQILPLSRNDMNANTAIPVHRPSLLIFTIDSMSRGNFIRSLPLTYEYLVGKHKMNVFKGLNKVADNTFPNMMALLAGYMAYQRDDMPGIPVWSIKNNSTMKRYDDMPIVWKTFKESKYVTMYAEEYMDATFSLLDVGFLEDPVDYYYRSTYVSLQDTLSNINMNKLKFWDRSKWRYCLGNTLSYKYVLNYTEEFLTEMADMRYFALSFFVEMSHEFLNDVKVMDRDLLDFFQKMFEGGMFNNTVVLVMGDHGHRFDAIRSTYIGRIEERMPFLGIWLPENLKKSHPHLQKALQSHTERLLSWYDIHETLVDLAEDDLGEMRRNPRPGSVGKSIFRLFDDNRTCSQIGILPEYCMCDREAQIPKNSEKALTSAEIVMQHINKLLEDSPTYIRIGESRSCAYLKMSRVTSASVSMKSYSSQAISLLVRVAFQVHPSDGLFEGAVEYAPGSPPVVMGDVNRINKYGNQPECISHDTLRLYCFCT